jgi:hypothetical protein
VVRRHGRQLRPWIHDRLHTTMRRGGIVSPEVADIESGGGGAYDEWEELGFAQNRRWKGIWVERRSMEGSTRRWKAPPVEGK